MNKLILSAVLGIFVLTAGGGAARAVQQTPLFTPPASINPSPVPGDVLVCMQNAVEKRDSAIITAFDKFAVAKRAALVARKDGLKAAWGKTDRKERREAIRKTWSDYKKASKEAKNTLRKERRTAWEQFTKDRKVCNAERDGHNGEDDDLD